MNPIAPSRLAKMNAAAISRIRVLVLPRVCAKLASLVAATTIANAQSISHVATTQLNTNGDSFGISVKAGAAKYKRATALGEGTGTYGDGTLLDWRIHTGVSNENPWSGNAVSAGPGTYFDVPKCSEIVGGPQNWLKVYTTADIDVPGFGGADITTGTVPQIGSSAVPLTGNIKVSGLTDGKFYVVAGAFSQTVTINLTMTGPGQTPLTASHVIGSPGNNNRLHSVEFSFSNPGGNYYNIAYSVNHGGNLARRRAGGVLLDGTLFVDTTEPTWVATWPNAGPVSGSLFSLNGNTNEDSTAYYVVLPDGATAPTSAQVKAGNDASDAPALASGDFPLSALVQGSEMVTGLTASTAYDVYVVAEDVRGPNLQATPVLVDVTTTAPDLTAPGWTATYPQQSRTPAGLTGIGNIDEPGTAYFVALPSGAPAPTSAQVKAGTDASDVAAPSGSMALPSPGNNGSATIAGLTIGATHDVWFVAEDLEGNLQAAPTSVISTPVGPVSQFATGGFAWGTASVWSATSLGPYNGPWGSGNNAVFEGGFGVVAIGSGTVVNDITFNSNSWILQGGPLTLAGTTQPVINVNANTPAFQCSLAGSQGFRKTGSGALRMTGTNSITGGFVIDGGWLGDDAGAPGTAALNNNHITANVGAVGLTLAGGTTTNGGITINATTLSISNNNSSITVNGAVTGTGGITLNKTGDGQNLVSLLSTANTFTGGVDYTGNRSLELNVNSFVDSLAPGTGKIRFGLGTPSDFNRRNRFALLSGAIAPLTLTNRQFEIASAGSDYPAQIYNNSAQAFTISSDLIVSGTGAKTLELGGDGAGANTFAGKIVNGTATLAVTKSGSGTWVLSGANEYTGITTVSAGTLLINGNQSLAIGAIAVNGTSTLGGAGTTGGTVTVAAGAKIAPGNAGIGTFAIGGGLNISALAGGTGTLIFQLDTVAGSDKITVTGAADIGSGTLGLGDFVFTDEGGLAAGTYKLITSSAPITGPLDAVDVTGTISGLDVELKINGNDLELVVDGGGSGDYDVWAATFLPTVIGLPGEDDDGDGLTNDQERIFGLNPTSGTSMNPISVPLDSSTGTFSFTRRDTSLTGLVYKVWYSTNLTNWEVDANAGFTPGAVVDQVQSVAVSIDPVLLDEPKLFLRVGAEEYVPPPPLLSTDFEDDDGGFTVATLGGTAWAHGAPNSPTQGGGAVTAGAGGSAKCWATNLTGGYVASTDTSLRSPVIDLTSVTSATLSFAKSVDSQAGHTLEVNVIDDTTDTVIANIIPATEDGNTSVSPWETVAPVALPPAAYGQAIRIEWRFVGDGNGSYNGAYIDNVEVVESP